MGVFLTDTGMKSEGDDCRGRQDRQRNQPLGQDPEVENALRSLTGNRGQRVCCWNSRITGDTKQRRAPGEDAGSLSDPVLSFWTPEAPAGISTAPVDKEGKKGA